MKFHRLALIVSVVFAVGSSSARAESPRVVASIAPLASLARDVVGERGRVDLLVEANRSPHGYAMRPSQRLALSRADVIFTIGDYLDLEAFLEPIVRDAPSEVRVVEALSLEGLLRLSLDADEEHSHREHGSHALFEEDADHADHADHAAHDDHDDHDDHAAHDDHADHVAHGGVGGVDPHVWLHPRNAGLIASALAEALSEIDPSGASHYRGNAEALNAEIESASAEISARFASSPPSPYATFHGAYRYFELAFGLPPSPRVVSVPGRPLGASAALEARRRLAESGTRCLLLEPQFASARDKARTVLNVPTGLIDPLAPVASGSSTEETYRYVDLLRSLARSIETCSSG